MVKICTNFIVLFLLTISLVSCSVGKIKEFSANDLKWFKPFTQVDTIIFETENNELDSVIFFKTDTSKYSARNLEQGYYDTRTLSVQFILTKGSYHQFAKLGDNNNYRQDIFRLTNSSSDNYTNFEIYFLGIIFNGKELQNILKVDSDTYVFEGKKATYASVNINEGINKFTFSLTKGVISYIDKRNVEWKRKKGGS